MDSAVALHLLLKEGHNVTAYHIKTVPDTLYLTKQIKHKVCCSPSDTFDAKKIAKHFNVEFKIVHLEKDFSNTVIKYFVKEYKNGRTPNPCFFCNDWIKFGVLFEKMLNDGMDYVASGHYARIINGKLYKAVSPDKDQSYFLASIKKEKLSKILLPNGIYTKEEIRKIAKSLNIHVHDKKESQDLCFIPDNDIFSFLEENKVTMRKGLIIDSHGNVLGTHKGIQNYTIGQRKIGVATGKKLYVKYKDPEKNLLIVASKEELYNTKFIVEHVNFLQNVSEHFEGYVKVRKKFKEVYCKVSIKNGKLYVNTEEPIFAITPGQIAVFYDNDNAVIAAGVIKEEGWNA
ncbi:tRNA 2-thiouridine(34) synthase MnmA [Thermosipho ferrireducens]|uniref:tRNA 2-thiouridine(34) synthase MnmA n=1 Tax=Thermosipho ferrireducens TaxID=2571116 RepID=UPI00224BAA0B|nr:tRNA 2-thiouridine(34) synthase MnmA [Thermosipho ferrireducens]